MTIKKTITQEIEVKTLHVEAVVRYWQDAYVNGVTDEEGNLIPCRDGDSWRPIIDIETGIIINWTHGIKADIHYKVCDEGTYTLKDSDGEEVIKINGYVPNLMSPKANGYGDYIIMDIDEVGVIQHWNPDLSDFDDTGD